MEKTKRSGNAQQAGSCVNIVDILATQDKIVDWLTAHDEAEREKYAKIEDEYLGPSITDELEAGLVEHNETPCSKHDHDGHKWCDGERPCTFILLPTAKYEEYLMELRAVGPIISLKDGVYDIDYHNIPVWPAPCDKVVYGTAAI